MSASTTPNARHENLTYDTCACVTDEHTQEIPDSQRFVSQISLDYYEL